jgi:hypothetical protein
MADEENDETVSRNGTPIPHTCLRPSLRGSVRQVDAELFSLSGRGCSPLPTR